MRWAVQGWAWLGSTAVGPVSFGYAPLECAYVGLVSGALGSAGIGWAGLGCFYYTGLGSVELYSSPLELAGLDWVGLGWAGRSEVRLTRAGLGVA